jgi:hypothetical protein
MHRFNIDEISKVLKRASLSGFNVISSDLQQLFYCLDTYSQTLRLK